MSSYFYTPSDSTNSSPPPLPLEQFLYPKLAPLTSANSSYSSNIYYQINQTAFSELKYDALGQIWYSTVVWLGSLQNGTLGTTVL